MTSITNNFNNEISHGENCIFCKIVKKEIPASIVHEDDFSVSFLNINPVNEGHLLIIPKQHFPYMLDVPDDILEKLFLKAKQLMSAVMKGSDANM